MNAFAARLLRLEAVNRKVQSLWREYRAFLPDLIC
jgi:hypothetical protein